jgi:hypothetical protein
MKIKSREIQMIEFIDVATAIKEKLPQYDGYDIWEVFNEDGALVTCWDLDAVKWLYDSSSELLIYDESDEWQGRVKKVSAATLDLIYAGELPDEFIMRMR